MRLVTVHRLKPGRLTVEGTLAYQVTASRLARACNHARLAVPSGAGTGLADVRAPLPGTFYRAARPGAPPFVEIGAPVEPATVVAIVETMKLMNSVHAGVAGVIEQIGVGDAQPVAQGAVLMRIRPTRP